MKIKKDKTATPYLADTRVENIFINEYMPQAPAAFVKVYLLSLMRAECGEDLKQEEICRQLGMSEEDLNKAWRYWEKAGLLRREEDGLVFVSLKEKLYGEETPGERAPSTDYNVIDDGRIKELFNEIEEITGEFLSGTTMQEILSWVEEYGTKTELISAAYKYAASRGKADHRYVRGVLRGWRDQGITTAREARESVEQTDERHHVYRRVMKALGFTRNPSEREMEIMDGWIDDLGSGMEEILEACGKTSGIPNPNVNYVDRVLRNKIEKRTKGRQVPRSVVMQRYEKMRDKARSEADARRDEIYDHVPEIKKIDEESAAAVLDVTKMMMSGEGERAKDLRRRIDEMERKKNMLLVQNNIPVDYADIRYSCSLCRDTGIKSNGEVCSCYPEVARMAELELSQAE